MLKSIAGRPCSVARSLEVLGDRWTFLVLREAFFGARRYGEFHGKLGIARNILADRLKHLVAHGILEKHPYQERPVRYEYRLTPKGLDLYPLILMLIRWGDRWLAGPDGPPLPLTHQDCGAPLVPAVVCAECGTAATTRNVSYAEGPGAETAARIGESAASA